MFTWMMFNKGTFEDKTQIRTKHTMQAKGCISTCIAIERDGCLVPGFVGQYRFFLCANHNSTGTLQACRSTAASQWHSRRIILRGPHFPGSPLPRTLRLCANRRFFFLPCRFCARPLKYLAPASPSTFARLAPNKGHQTSCAARSRLQPEHGRTRPD